MGFHGRRLIREPSLVLLFALLSACGTKDPFKHTSLELQAIHLKHTSLELQAIQAREFDASENIGFGSVISVFQDLGYIIVSADREAGFITSKSPSKNHVGWYTYTLFTMATAHIEELRPGSTRIRLNFVERKKESFAGREIDTPILDPAVYTNAFVKIQEAIFVRSGS